MTTAPVIMAETLTARNLKALAFQGWLSSKQLFSVRKSGDARLDKWQRHQTEAAVENDTSVVHGQPRVSEGRAGVGMRTARIWGLAAERSSFQRGSTRPPCGRSAVPQGRSFTGAPFVLWDCRVAVRQNGGNRGQSEFHDLSDRLIISSRPSSFERKVSSTMSNGPRPVEALF